MLPTFCDITAHFNSAAHRFDTPCSKKPTRILTIRGDNLTQATTTSFIIISSSQSISTADLCGSTGGLRPLACWDCRFESRQGHRCVSAVSAVCCKAEVFPTTRSLVQRLLPCVRVTMIVIRSSGNPLHPL
jgi:hypothetical protein